MRRGLEPGYGSFSEALPEETGSKRPDWTCGTPRQSSTLPESAGEVISDAGEVISSVGYRGAGRLPLNASSAETA